uniref:Sex hormone binding globulin n=1 Tax=Vombatus ursinus TaxID=29139 RepID=A0A4X2K4V0_VOMUR
MTFDLTKVTRAISSFDLRTWDPEGVIFYGDTNPKDDWFMLVLRGAGPRLDDGCWHQLIPALDGCLRRDIWLNQPGNTAPFSHPPQGACNPEAQPGTFLPPGAHTVFSLQDLPQPDVDPWAFSLELRLQFFRGSGCLLTLGILANQSLLSLDLQDQYLDSGCGPLEKGSLPLSPGRLLQLELGLTRVTLSQGPQEVALIVPPVLLISLLDLWTQPKGNLILGVAPGEASSVSFCLDGLRVQGKELDVDQALSRSKNIWTHSCPRSLNNSTNTPH